MPAMPTQEYSSAGNTFSMSRCAMTLPIVARRSPAMTTPPGNAGPKLPSPSQRPIRPRDRRDRRALAPHAVQEPATANGTATEASVATATSGSGTILADYNAARGERRRQPNPVRAVRTHTRTPRRHAARAGPARSGRRSARPGQSARTGPQPAGSNQNQNNQNRQRRRRRLRRRPPPRPALPRPPRPQPRPQRRRRSRAATTTSSRPSPRTTSSSRSPASSTRSRTRTPGSSAPRGYFASPDDVYVANSYVRRFGLRRGDAVTGAIRAAARGRAAREVQPAGPPRHGQRPRPRAGQATASSSPS